MNERWTIEKKKLINKYNNNGSSKHEIFSKWKWICKFYVLFDWGSDID